MNPTASRLDQLHDQWVEFADDAALRLLVWQLGPGEAALVDALVARESEPELAETPDIFVQLATPFRSETQHAHELAKELAAQYAEATAGQDEADRGSDGWDPSLHAAAANPRALVAMLCSLREQHLGGDSDGVLAVLLIPEQVSSFDAYQRWLQCLTHEAPKTLRFIVIDERDGSVYAALTRAEPARVRAVCCALDVPAMMNELAQQGGESTPGAKLRVLCNQLGASIEAGDLQAARPLAASALALARAQGWPHLGASVQITLAAAYAMHGEHEQALHTYAECEQLLASPEALGVTADHASEDEGGAPDAPASPASTCEQLRLQAILGRASVLLATRGYAAGAVAYLEAASLAESLGVPRTAVDAQRMASFCWAQNGEIDKAWTAGHDGLRCGLAMDEDTRATSTLPQLAAQLLHITETRRAFASHRKPLEQKLAASLGADWRAQLDRAAES